MDTRHFDALTRALFRPVSRRTVLGVLLAGLPTAVAGADAAGGKGGTGGGGKKRQRRGRGSSAPTCHDRVRNGTETDVDCGGGCPRCPNGKLCRGQDDCESGLCVSGVCRACVVDTDCGIDAAGPCRCDTVDRETQQEVCNNALGGPSVADCGDCPEGTNCHRVDLGEWVCRSFCGAP